MKHLFPIALLVAALGFAIGSLGVRAFGPVSTSKGATISEQENAERTTLLTPQSSGDSVASLSKTPAIDLYPRLALWLLEASTDEIEEFWNAYLKRSDQSPALTQLILINWTRVDAPAALSATKGTEFERMVWTAWAGNDPDLALREALAHYPADNNNEIVLSVVRSLGKTNPAWLRENFQDLPEDWMRDHALSAYSQIADSENPRETVKFLREHGRIIHSGTLSAFARESPLEALNFALDLRARDSSYSYTNQPDDIIAALAKEDPALLDQIMPHLKSPETKMKIQLKQFEILLQSDPAAAEKKILDLPTGWAKQDHLALLGGHYLKNDPTKSLKIADQILTEKGRFGWRPFGIMVDGKQYSSVPMAAPPSSLFLDQLLAQHPQELMEVVLTSNEQNSRNYQTVGSAWAKRDLPGYADWAAKQTDHEIYPQFATTVTTQLLKEGHMNEAMEWAESIPATDPSASTMISQTYRQWLTTAPEAAKSWKENATLNEAQLRQINQIESERE